MERRAYQPLFENVDMISKRKPTRSSFDTIIEIKARGEYVVHEDADKVIVQYLDNRGFGSVNVNL